MDLDSSEATTRWHRVRGLIKELDLDLLVAVDASRDEILQSNARWLTGYIPIGGPAAAIVTRTGDVELVTDRIGQPVVDYYAAHDIPIRLTSAFSPHLLAERIAHYAPKRVGAVEAESFSYATVAALDRSAWPPELVDVTAAFGRLRLRKSPAELAAIRQSCAIADSVWRQMRDIVRIGRRNYEIVADIEHIMRCAGAEGGFNLVLPLPFRGRAMRSLANPEPIQSDRRYLVEVSPRYRGYYSQLTMPVSTVANDEAARLAYADLIEAIEHALPLMTPGSDLSVIAEATRDFLGARGRTMSSLSLGHFCGLALEEPRHDPAAPFILEADMTMIFHPVLADPELHSLMRADTYVITPSGAARLNRIDTRFMQVG